MTTCDCGWANAPRRYLDETTYICKGYYQAGIDHYGYPVVFNCDTKLIDEVAVARIEAAAERERAKRQVLLDAAAAAPPHERRYCHVCDTTLAVRRCGRCRADLCVDDEHCCTWRSGLNTWVCRPCHAALDAELRQAAKEEKARERARYEALPLPSVDELARHLNGEKGVVVDGTTHRVDGVTYGNVAAAFAALLGPRDEGVSWSEGSATLLLDSDGTLRRTSSLSGPEKVVAGASDRCDLTRIPLRAGVAPLAEYRTRQRADADERAEAARRRAVDERRRARSHTFHVVLRPLLVVSPAIVLLVCGILSYRTGLADGVTLDSAQGFEMLLIPVVILSPPAAAFCVLIGGFLLASNFESHSGPARARALVLTWAAPLAAGLLLGKIAITESPLLQDLAATPFADHLVALYGTIAAILGL